MREARGNRGQRKRGREGKERAGESNARAEHNGPPRRFGNVETHDPEWETDEDLAPAGSQDNASWKTNVNAGDNAV